MPIKPFNNENEINVWLSMLRLNELNVKWNINNSLYERSPHARWGINMVCTLQLMRLDSSFESLAGLTSGRAGSMADLAEDTPRRSVHRHSYAAPSHNDPEIPTPTKPFGLGKLQPHPQYSQNISPYYQLKYIFFYSTRHTPISETFILYHSITFCHA